MNSDKLNWKNWPVKKIWPAVLLIAICSAIILWIAPTESSIGKGILYVYIHVALIQTGRVGLFFTALIGLIQLITNKSHLRQLILSAGWVSVVFYAVGTLVSILAAIANWGVIFLAEPLYKYSALVLIFTSGILISSEWVKSNRIVGAMTIGIALFLLWADSQVELVMHPDNPIGTSSSNGIKFTFLSLFLLNVIAAGLFIYKYFFKMTKVRTN